MGNPANPYNIHPIRPGVTDRVRIVSLNLPAQAPQGVIQFGPQNDLIGMRITCVELVTVDMLAADPNNNSQAPLDIATAVNLSMTLKIYDPAGQSPEIQGFTGEWIENIPLLRLFTYVSSSTGNYNRFPFLLPGTGILWEQSKIKVVAKCNNTNPLGICLAFHYTSSNYNTYDLRKNSGAAYN